MYEKNAISKWRRSYNKKCRDGKLRGAAEADRSDEHMDKKLEILTRTIDVAEDEDKENQHVEVNVDLESENERLRREVAMLRRDLQSRSPSKKGGGPLQRIEWGGTRDGDVENQQWFDQLG